MSRRDTSAVNEALDRVASEGLALESDELTDWSRTYFAHARRRHASDAQLIARHATSAPILEIGSLPCHFTLVLKELGYDVVGIDIDPGRAKSLIERSGLDVRRCDIEHERLPFSDGMFDLVLLIEVFEHLRINPLATLREINRVTKPGGKLILATPNLYSFARILRFLRGAGIDDPVKAWSKLDRLGHMGHVRVYTRANVCAMLRQTGLEPIELRYRSFEAWRPPRPTRLLLEAVHLLFPGMRPNQVVVARKPP